MTPKKGNTNAVKHGIFAKRIAVIDDIEGVEKMKSDSNEAELAHARAMLADASDKRQAATGDDKLKWDYACRHWSEVIESMTFHNFNRGQSEVMVFETLLSAMRAANDSQKVKR